MFEKLKANILFHQIMKRPDIDKAYAMVGPEDAWYDTISTVHRSLSEIQKLPHEILETTTPDGLKLKAVYYPGNSAKTAVWVHGYTSHAERESAFPGLFYLSMGFNVLIPYQRAHGLSEGKYLSFGALEQQDMLLWVDKMNEIHPDGEILIHGLSMGGGIVLDLATREIKNVKCLIADAPNETIVSFLHGITSHVFKKNTEAVYTHVLARYQKEFSQDATAYNRVENIAGGHYPLLLSAGENEKMEFVFSNLAKRNPMPTEVLILPGCSHGNGMYKQTEMYQAAIKAFIEKYMSA